MGDQTEYKKLGVSYVVVRAKIGECVGRASIRVLEMILASCYSLNVQDRKCGR